MKWVICLSMVVLAVSPVPAWADDDNTFTGTTIGVVALNAIAWIGNGAAIAKEQRNNGAAVYGIVIGGLTVVLGSAADNLGSSNANLETLLIGSGTLSISLAIVNLIRGRPGENHSVNQNATRLTLRLNDANRPWIGVVSIITF